MEKNTVTEQGPPLQVQDRRAQLEEAEETLRAIRCREIDALVVSGPRGDRVYSLEGAEHYYRVMVEAMSEGAVTLMGDSSILYSNQSFAAMLKLPLEQVIGSSMLGLVLAADLPIFERLVREGRQGSSRGEIRLQAKDGSAVPVYFSVSTLEAGATPAVCAVVTDLTTQKCHQELIVSERIERAKRAEAESGRQRIANTEEKLWRSEAGFRSYFELGLVGMAMTSPAKGILEVNDELCRILGYPREELLQKTWPEMTHPDDLPADVAQFDRVLAGEIDGYTLDKRFICKDRRVIDTIMAAKCLRRSDHSVDYFLGLILETTERRRAEEKLQQAHSELARVAHATTLGELAASIAHEINQPLGAIVNNGNACLRLLRTRAWSELREAITAMVDDANRASAIIARTRARLSRSAPEKVRLQLQDVVADVLALAQRDLAKRRIVVRTDLHHNVPSVWGDRVQLQEVLLNLIRNALEAMSEEADERQVMMIGCWQSELQGKPAVLLTVQDRGCGFSQEEAGRIFDAFYTTKPNGIGMGLRICRSIAEAHGGRLTASLNSDGPGAMFSLLLPAVGQHNDRRDHGPS